MYEVYMFFYLPFLTEVGMHVFVLVYKSHSKSYLDVEKVI